MNNSSEQAEFELIRKIKETCTYCTTTDKKEARDESKPYLLPDGTQIKLRSDCLTDPPEIMFHPDLMGLEYPGVHEMIYNSIMKCDIDLRPEILKNIVFVGGNTMIADFTMKISENFKKIFSSNTKVTLSAPAENRTKQTWLGGGFICQLQAFNSLWITKKELQESMDRVFLQKAL